MLFRSRSYLNRPEATERAKIVDASGGFWHRMGDLGSVDDPSAVQWFVDYFSSSRGAGR